MSANLCGKEGKVELIYWPLRGLGSVPRMALTVAGIPFIDSHTDPSYFAEGGLLSKLQKQTPLANLPALRFEDGTVISQSNAILRAIGRAVPRLAGETEAEKLAIDQVFEVLVELNRERGTLVRGADFEANKKAFLAETIPYYFGVIDAFIAKNGTAFSGSASISIADLYLFEMADIVKACFGDLAALAPYPRVLAIYKAVEELPALAAYHEAAAKIPINGPGAHFSAIKF